MIKNVWSLLIVLLFECFLVLNCVPVKVNHGPFIIEESSELVAEKVNYLAGLTEQANDSSRPNILIILVDDLAKHDIALYDSHGVSTPHINGLAESGVLFSRAFTSSPVCSPARAALFTGRYQQRFGFERQPMNRYPNNKLEYLFVDHFMNVEPMRLLPLMADVPKDEIEKQGIPLGEVLLPEVMLSAGYNTGLCGKWHLGNANKFHPNQRGFNFQYGFNEAFTLYSPENTKVIIEHRHDYFANKHIWRQKRDGSSAICLNDSIIHEEEYLTFAIAREAIKFIKSSQDEPFFLVSAFNAPHTPFQVPTKYYDMFPNEMDHNKRVYYGMIAALDDAIGMMLEELTNLGLRENTLILFASDNGGATYTDATDNGPLKAGKFSQFEGGVNIPMVLNWEGHHEEGIVFNEQVSLLDVLPTVLESAGLSIPVDRRIDGLDLISQIDNSQKLSHDYLFWRTDYNKAIRSKEWKLIWNTWDEQLFLFDLSQDNFENINVADENPQVVEELGKIYKNWESEMKDPLWPGVMEIMFEVDGQETWWAI
ncbi:MAG: sulfatase-like hydrolase/transferase [Bacteroidales bacterium]|nr:sulfatase-like hydrolase/transferase [Bacteroidales bacterium]